MLLELCDQETSRAKVADFGLARSINRNSNAKVKLRETGASAQDVVSTMTAAVGTPQYLPPELCENEKRVLARWDAATQKLKTVFHHEERAQVLEEARQFSETCRQVEYGQGVDIYAYGVCLWEMITHQAPWSGVPRAEIYEAVSNGSRLSLPLVTQEGDDSSPQWCDLMSRCWHADAKRRPACQEMMSELEQISGRQMTLPSFEISSDSKHGVVAL